MGSSGDALSRSGGQRGEARARGNGEEGHRLCLRPAHRAVLGTPGIPWGRGRGVCRGLSTPALLVGDHTHRQELKLKRIQIHEAGALASEGGGERERKQKDFNFSAMFLFN